MRDFLIGDGESLEKATQPFSLEELQEVPYYKRPLVQTAAVLGVGLPLIWLISMAFKGGEPQVAKSKQIKVDAEKTQLISALDAEREKNRQLALKNAMYEQKIDVVVPQVKAQPKPQTKSQLKPKPAPVKHAVQPTPQPTVVRRRSPQPVSRPATRTPVRTTPVVEAPAIPSKPEPPVDPMQQWLAMADQGFYVGAVPEQNTQLVSQKTTVIRDPLPSASTPELLDDAQLNQGLQGDLLDQEELTARLDTSNLTQRRIVNQKTPAHSADNNLISKPRSFSGKKQVIDIGSTAKAVLESAVVWSSGSNDIGDRKYLLRLKEDFENIDGKTILAKDTRLIAQVRGLSGSGIISMEITQVIHEGQRIEIPAGYLVVEGKKGSPLKADLKQKGDSDFWGDVASIAAPGIERALDQTSETIVVQNGSVFRSDSRDPLASGISGVIDGANKTLNRRLNNQRETVVSYFQLDSNKTVYLRAYEDISF